jgi:cytochrome P450/deferrochelatase/peroxidase EfeB
MGVSSGLNLWLELRDPADMGELLEKLLDERDAIHAALGSLHYVHFARFLPTPDWRALQVITSFDGEFDAYVMDFVLAIGDQFETILSYVKDRPPSRVKDHPAAFLAFIRANNLGYEGAGGGNIDLYSAYPERTVIDIIGSTGTGPVPVEPTPVDVDRGDVQANVLRGIAVRHAWHGAFRGGATGRARNFVAELVDGSNGAPQVTSDAPWVEGSRPAYALTLGFTYAGLLAMGIGEQDRAALELAHASFVAGPDGIQTATANGDVDASSPDYWQLGGPHPVDIVVSVYGDEEGEVSKWSEAVMARARAHQLSVVGKPWLAHALLDERYPGHHFVHFGYADGLSQPQLAIHGTRKRSTDSQPLANVGEILLGAQYPNVYGGRDSLGGLSPQLAQNATFAAFRIMEQDVVEFEALLEEAAIKHRVPAEWIAAKLMGRWRDGTPVSIAPGEQPPKVPAPENDFDYLPTDEHKGTPDDSAGRHCPIGAHIRRMNPRSSIVAGRSHSRRLLRRGMPYGPKFDPKGPSDGQARGLIGVFLCADLNRQFEFILRQWAQGDRATAGLVGQQDPLLGAQTLAAEYRIPRAAGGDIVLKMPRLLTTVGSAYLFMPGIAGLKYLSGGQDAKVEPTFRSTTFSKQLDLWNLNPAVQPDPATFDPREPSHRADPFVAYAWFRDHQPVAKLGAMNSTWVFSYKDISAAAGSLDKFRKRKSGDKQPSGFLNMDPPSHSSCRAEAWPLFQQALAAAAGEFQPLIAECYERCRNQGQAKPLDWIRDFAKPVARGAFFTVFGLPLAEVPAYITEIETILRLATPADDPKVRGDVGKRLEELAPKLFFLAMKRVPGRMFDLILQMQGPHDASNNRPRPPASARKVEQLVNALSLSLAGFLPLQWFIATATWHMLANDGALLKEIKADASISNRDVVVELLRFDMTAPMAERHAIANTQLGGIALNADDRVMLAFASANRDPAEFGPTADRIDFKRTKKGPGFAFGYRNEHSCLGEDLVYQVMEPVIQVLRDANPEPRLAAGFTPSWGTFAEGAMFRAMSGLLVHC